jgi:excisionase family DNA binding protein
MKVVNKSNIEVEKMVTANLSMALTPEQIAAETSLHVNTVYALLKKNEIPHVKLCRRYLVSRVEFEKWLAGQQLAKNEK